MNPWHYASRQSYNTFKGNSFQKDAVEDKLNHFQSPLTINTRRRQWAFVTHLLIFCVFFELEGKELP
jgi:hypothetical protein